MLVTLGAQAEPIPLRQTDWPSVLASDPALEIDSQMQPTPLTSTGPYVRLAHAPSPDQPAVEGFALLGDILYGDLDADGAEEAVVLLGSGGTAGVVGLLVYHADTPRPRLAAALGGYKLGARIDKGELIVLQPRYAGFEPNCCPSAELETHYSLAGLQLLAISEQEQPLMEAQVETVQQFYADLDRHALTDAYDLLSEAYRQAQPYDAWSGGYQTTERVQIDELAQTDSGVEVAFTSYDRDPSGSQEVRHFKGTWSLVWGAAVHHWLLDSADIAEIT
jgi:hypothetical protein